MDRVRASDSEREEAVAALRAAAAEGRLDVQELDERTASAYAAATRGELSRLLDDLPEALPAARPPRKPPRIPGRFGFSEHWRAPVRSRDAEADLLEFVAPPLTAYGYRLVEHTPGRLVFERSTRPAWTILAAIVAFPIGLFALLYTDEERITLQLVARGNETVIVAQGVAPLRVRKAFALLEP